MKVNTYRIKEDNGLERTTPDQAAKGLSDATSCLWIDIEQPSVDGLKDLLAPLDLHPLVFDNCLEPAASPLLAPYNKCLFVRMPIQQSWDRPDIGFLCIIGLSNAIVTVHASPAPSLEKLADGLKRWRKRDTARFQAP
ncbi:MAG: hypothetical protein KAT62_08365 [Desulfuromonadales bacterium]|nr:hypothetical protein [Desulfuromonadales bacterium]